MKGTERNGNDMIAKEMERRTKGRNGHAKNGRENENAGEKKGRTGTGSEGRKRSGKERKCIACLENESKWKGPMVTERVERAR